MPKQYIIRQVGVKHMGFRVEIMKWSNKMDLMAIANERGEVIILRLNWKKVCTFPPPADNIKVKALSWQPNETSLAVGYSNGKVSFYDTEMETEIYSFNLDGAIKTLHFTRAIDSSEYTDSFSTSLNSNIDKYLIPLPNLSSLSSGVRKIDTSENQILTKYSTTFLVVCLENGEIFISIQGILNCGKLDLKEYLVHPQNFEVQDVRMNVCFSELIAFVKDGPDMKVLNFSNPVLERYTCSLWHISIKYGHVLGCFSYIQETIQCIIEAWETVLLEMDNKLSKYANSKQEGSISADFLELLLFGSPSEALEEFLTRDLTEKGLKKLGSSIELSYSTIQNLVFRPLQSAAINLFYHVNILKGLSRNTYCYKDLISPKIAEELSLACGSFLIKILELQQTVDQSVNDYKIFWCWLCVVVVRLMDESVPDEVASVTQEDIAYLAEFLNNFDNCVFQKEDGNMGKRKFILERVGQYLENSNLEFPSKVDRHHQWDKLINENECLKDSPFIFNHNKTTSLIQEQNNLQSKIAKFFSKCDSAITNKFTLKCSMKVCDMLPQMRIKFTLHSDKNTKTDLVAAIVNHTEILIMEMNSKSNVIDVVNLNFACPTGVVPLSYKVSVIDMKFYNDSFLSVLLEINEEVDVSYYFLQLPIATLRNKEALQLKISKVMELGPEVTRLNVEFFSGGYNFLIIEGIFITSLAVSGTRNVASVLSESFQKIRIYELELEDEDKEMDTNTTTTQSNTTINTTQSNATSFDVSKDSIEGDY